MTIEECMQFWLSSNKEFMRLILGPFNKLFSLLCFLAGLGSEDEVRLVEYLFDRQGYNPLIRPVRNLTEKVNVKFGLAMIQLINVVRTILQ